MKKIIIIGAGVAGGNVLEEINKTPELDFNVVGFIDDDLKKKNGNIFGKKILGSSRNFRKIVKKYDIDQIIIAIPSAESERIRKYVKLCSEEKVSFRIVPRVREIIEGQAHIQEVRKVQLDDLLGRPVVKSEVESIKRFFRGKNVLITGSAGSIGSELSRQVSAYRPKSLILLDWWENGLFEIQNELISSFPDVKLFPIIGNIQDKEKISRIMKEFKPNYIFHAAAYKHVPLMESFPEEAVKNNVIGSLNIMEEARNNGVEKFIVISSDKAANPINVMGATKLITEAIGLSMNGKTKYISVRFGNVLGSFGSVVPIFRKQIEKGGPLEITDKRMERYFMTISEAVHLILKAALIGNGGELFVLDMGKPVKIIDLAEQLIRLSGYIPGKEIKIKYTGLRLGEKLKEDLFTKDESLKKTKERKIFKSKSSAVKIKNLKSEIEKLNLFAIQGERILIREELGKIMKTFPVKNNEE